MVDKKTQIGRFSQIPVSCKIGKNVKIGNSVIIEGDVQIGDNTIIDHNVIIRGTTKIGRDNWIYPYCIIGTEPQNRASKDTIPSNNKIIIGDGNIIREFTTVHLPTVNKKTFVGSHCYIMANSHIAHDVIIHDSVTLANLTTLGGHAEIFQYANLGFSTIVHQFCKIGAYSMIGMNSAITKDVLPFALMNCQTFTKINKIGLERNGISQKEINAIQTMYVNKIPPKSSKRWYELELKRFLDISTRGIYQPCFV